MRLTKRSIFLCLLCSLFVGCSTPKFVVKSDPLTADVFLLVGPLKEKKPIGKTPLEMPIEEVAKTLGTDTKVDFYTVLIEKPGFETQQFNIPANGFMTRITALDVKMRQGEDQVEMNLAKEILDYMFLAQKFAISGQFERAQIELDKVIAKFPKFDRALSMRASIYFAQKNYQESLKWYDEALKVNPDLEEAVKFSAKVRLQLGLPPSAMAPAGGDRQPATPPTGKVQ